MTAVNTGTGVISLDRSLAHLHRADYPEWGAAPAGFNVESKARVMLLTHDNGYFQERLIVNDVTILDNPNYAGDGLFNRI